MTTTGVQSDQSKVLHDLIKNYYSNDALQPDLPSEKLKEIAEQVKAIQDYAHDLFPLKPILTDEECVILTLSIRVLNPSPEKSVVAKDTNYMEIKRTLSRFYCLELLQKGDEGYEAFVACQVQDSKFMPRLTLQQYREVAKKYQNLDAVTLEAHKIATLISSVPLSSEAQKRAALILGKDQYIIDSVEFPARVFEDIEVARKVYPQVNLFLLRLKDESEQKRAIKLLKSAFPHHCHFRHMLYTEGRKHMFNTLIEGVRTGTLDKEGFNFWFLHWTTNIVGFRGQVDPKGSYYLTSNTFRAMSALESILQTVFEDEERTNRELLNDYLTQRAAMLGLADLQNTTVPLNLQTQILLAHVGAMMRLYHYEQGQLLSAAYLIALGHVDLLRKEFFAPDETMPTPTYVPALFDNAKDRLLERYEQESVFQTAKRIPAKSLNLSAQELKEMMATFESLVLCIPMYLKAMQEYKKLRAEKKIDPRIPLSFQTLANQKWIETLFDKSILLDKVSILELMDIKVSDKGIVSYDKKPDFDALLKAQQARGKELTDELLKPHAALVPAYQNITAARLEQPTAITTAPFQKEKAALY